MPLKTPLTKPVNPDQEFCIALNTLVIILLTLSITDLTIFDILLNTPETVPLKALIILVADLITPVIVFKMFLNIVDTILNTVSNTPVVNVMIGVITLKIADMMLAIKVTIGAIIPMIVEMIIVINAIIGVMAAITLAITFTTTVKILITTGITAWNMDITAPMIAINAGATISTMCMIDSISIVMTGSSADRKSTRLNSSHVAISYAVFCLNKKIPREAGAG